MWNKLQYFVSQSLWIPEITAQSALFRFCNSNNQKLKFLLINHLLLIFKHYLYMSRANCGAVCFTNLKMYLIKIKTIEQNISPCSSQKKEKFWRKYIETFKIFWNKCVIKTLILLSLSISVHQSSFFFFWGGEKFPYWYYLMTFF